MHLSKKDAKAYLSDVSFSCCSYHLTGTKGRSSKCDRGHNRLFSGMYRADSTMIRSAFAKEVTMATAFRNKEGVPVLRREYSINDFVKAVGQPQPEPLTEEIWNIKIQIDGDFAQA